MICKAIFLLFFVCCVEICTAGKCADTNKEFIDNAVDARAVCSEDPCPAGSLQLGMDTLFPIWCITPQKYCCNETLLTTTTAAPTSTAGPTVPPATCGYDAIPAIHVMLRIANQARATLPCEWPWMVSVGHNETGTFKQVCAGILIGNRTVLTTASCIDSVENVTSDIRVVVGDYDVTADASTDLEEKPFDVLTSTPHPDYDTVTGANNTGLLTLATHTDYNMCRVPMCLPAHGQEYSNKSACFVSGWGNKDVLSSARVEPLKREICETLADVLEFDFPDTELCGKAVKKDVDVCGKGDHGGMLVCPDHRGKYFLRGLISRTGCEMLSKPTGCKTPISLYTDVEQFVDWIDENK